MVQKARDRRIRILGQGNGCAEKAGQTVGVEDLTNSALGIKPILPTNHLYAPGIQRISIRYVLCNITVNKEHDIVTSIGERRCMADCCGSAVRFNCDDAERRA